MIIPLEDLKKHCSKDQIQEIDRIIKSEKYAFPEGFDKDDYTDDQLHKAFNIPAGQEIDHDNSVPLPANIFNARTGIYSKEGAFVKHMVQMKEFQNLFKIFWSKSGGQILVCPQCKRLDQLVELLGTNAPLVDKEDLVRLSDIITRVESFLSFLTLLPLFSRSQRRP